MSERREPTRIPMGGVDKCLLCGWQGQPDEPHGCPRYTDSAATMPTPSHGSLLLAYCERCAYEVYSVSQGPKFCPVPTCRGYLVHIDRSRHAA